MGKSGDGSKYICTGRNVVVTAEAANHEAALVERQGVQGLVRNYHDASCGTKESSAPGDGGSLWQRRREATGAGHATAGAGAAFPRGMVGGPVA